MVALQDSGVIVEHGELTAGIAQERVGPSRVIHVMDGGSDQGCHLVQLAKASLGSGDKAEHYPVGVRHCHPSLTQERTDQGCGAIRMFS